MNCYPPKIPTINIYRNSNQNMIFDNFIRTTKFIIILLNIALSVVLWIFLLTNKLF